MSQNLEAIACQPHPVAPNGFNPNANIPYGCTTEHIRLAMNDFIYFIGFISCTCKQNRSQASAKQQSTYFLHRQVSLILLKA